MTHVKRLGNVLAKTAKVKLLKGVIMGPHEVGKPGDIYELPKHQASELVAYKQAVYTDEGDASEHDDAGAAVHEAGYETVTMEEPTTRDPRPRRRG